MKKNQLRIIGGKYRGRKLSFPSVTGLRPTGDRIRETLFNWLAPTIEGARCLDLFAGSGSLGFEALSRGARHVSFIDSSMEVCHKLQSNLNLIAENKAEVCCLDAMKVLKKNQEPYDIIFLDPPFSTHLLPNICSHIDQQKLLSKKGFIYLEQGLNERSSEQQDLIPPSTWQLYRNKQAGNVCYQLYQHC